LILRWAWSRSYERPLTGSDNRAYSLYLIATIAILVYVKVIRRLQAFSNEIFRIQLPRLRLTSESRVPFAIAELLVVCVWVIF